MANATPVAKAAPPVKEARELDAQDRTLLQELLAD
ncbi:MAG: hypothetical protein QOC71_180, partial [Thermoplasmata archaeon]|nr:hypothetical protein [Thermoplasmata archaeon]